MTTDRTATERAAFSLLCYWIVERDRIRLAKEAGKPRPWTDNVYLQKARWCNVARRHDRVSQYLLNTWYGDTILASVEQIAVNAAMARLINWPDTLEELRAAGQNEDYRSATAHAVLAARRDRGDKVFTGAYKVSGIRGEDKVTTVIGQCDQVLRDYARLIDPSSMARTHARLQSIPAIGSFMAGQIVADLRYVHPGAWADRDTWAPLGPGSERGLARLRGWDGEDEGALRRFGITQANFPANIRQLREQLNAVPEVRAVLERVGAEAMDLQNCLCEFDKVSRYTAGQGDPKNLYR
ncbi:nucleotide kinase domain-containing protein [Rhizobacter fulvus]